jgi:hypothetical protein
VLLIVLVFCVVLFGGIRVAHRFSFLCCGFWWFRVAHRFSFLCCIFGGSVLLIVLVFCVVFLVAPCCSSF